MYVITGITGRIGGAVAKHLIAANQKVRAVVRVAEKGEEWARQGCDVALAGLDDVSALTAAFQGAEGVFVVIPPKFDSAPGFNDTKEVIKAVAEALRAAQPKKVVYLSSIGAQAKEANLLTQHALAESAMAKLPLPITFLRPAWLMENASGDIAAAKAKGVVTSFLQPFDKVIPMVAIDDIGCVGAQLIQEDWSGKRTVELEGPKRYCPDDVAATLSKLLGRDVRTQVIARPTWESFFKSQGMKNPEPRMKMLDGFNDGWIDFARGEDKSYKGSTTLEMALKEMIAKSTLGADAF